MASWDEVGVTSFEPANEMVVERDMQKTMGMAVVAFVRDARESFSRRMTRDDRSPVSGAVIDVTVKLRRMPR